jgi:hypothetical protein
MPDLKWCPNCNQNIAPQVEKRGCVSAILIIAGLCLVPFFIFGIILTIAGLVFFLTGNKTPSCPICKAGNLLDEKLATEEKDIKQQKEE